jgi:hypothetical protein
MDGTLCWLDVDIEGGSEDDHACAGLSAGLLDVLLEQDVDAGEQEVRIPAPGMAMELDTGTAELMPSGLPDSMRVVALPGVLGSRSAVAGG